MSRDRGRLRIIAFWIFVAACAAAAIGYTRWRLGVTAPGATLAPTLADAGEAHVASTLDATRAKPHLLFLSSRTDAFGKIGVSPLDNPESRTLYQTLECERAYFGRSKGVCLVLNRDSMSPRAYVYFLDAHLQPTGHLPLAGLPIRARVSRDERYGVATVFVSGENYASEDFTTRTTIFDIASQSAIVDLERFTVERDGKPFHDADFNFWGVTFSADSNRFFATLGTGGKRYLVEGNLANRHFTVVANDVECPSLSPDEKRVVFKRQRAVGTGWQLWAMDLASKQAWPITEDKQDVDDQVEWLDDDRVVYGMVSGTGLPEYTLSLWTSDARPDAGKNRKMFLQSALSPTVIR